MLRAAAVGLAFGLIPSMDAHCAWQSAPTTPFEKIADPPIPEDEDEWSQLMAMLLEYMCIILNCNGTRDSSGQAIDGTRTWIATYRSAGVRHGMSESERVFALDNVDRLSAMCRQDPGVLPVELRHEFETVLSEVQGQLLFEATP